jgi:hypothetical protein
VAGFLGAGLPIVQGEPATTIGFAIQFGSTTFGIFDAFPDDAGRQTHVNGLIHKLVQENADLFTQAPDFRTSSRSSSPDAPGSWNDHFHRPQLPASPQRFSSPGRWADDASRRRRQDGSPCGERPFFKRRGEGGPDSDRWTTRPRHRSVSDTADHPGP